jgi:hypothetical protein
LIKLLFILILFFSAACREKQSQNDKIIPQNKAKPAAASASTALKNRAQKNSLNPPVIFKKYPNAQTALKAITDKTKPLIIGFGEFHQMKSSIGFLSSIERFSKWILPALAPYSSDLIVETWVKKGCGKIETAVIKEVEEVSKRPKTTENETIRLLKTAKSLGIQPHILEVECDDYKRVFETDKEVDYFLMLELVGQLLREKGKKVFLHRVNKQPENRPLKKMILIYGGAVHNDIAPEKEWETVSFGPAMNTLSKQRYISVDLYVPEFIKGSNLVKNRPWYPLFEENASKSNVLLIKKTVNSYIIILKKGLKNGNLTSKTG